MPNDERKTKKEKMETKTIPRPSSCVSLFYFVVHSLGFAVMSVDERFLVWESIKGRRGGNANYR